MAQLAGGLNTQQEKPVTAMEPVPAGDYRAIITETSVAPSGSDPNNTIVKLTFSLCDPGPFQNRKVWANLVFATRNTTQKAQTAVQIGRGRLSAIAKAIYGRDVTINDTSELENKPLWIKVGLKRDQNGNPQNDFKGAVEVKPGSVAAAAQSVHAANQMVQQQQPHEQQPPQQQGTGSAAAWAGQQPGNAGFAS